MSMLLDDLRQSLATRPSRVVFIVGTGVTVGALHDSPHESVGTWAGLLGDGLRRVHELGTLDAPTLAHYQQQLGLSFPQALVGVADVVSHGLGAPHGGEFSRWLRETVGAFHDDIRDRAVLDALANHQRRGVLLATTNYDHLLETATALRPTNWRRVSGVERAIGGTEPRILHLHGEWEDPDSIVLGTHSYIDVARDAHARAVLTALRTDRTFVFVGCGAGLRDPNLGAFLKWTGETFGRAETRHFRLCRGNELEALRREHPAEQRIFPLPYGDNHADLAPFLHELLPASGSTRENKKTIVPASSVPAPVDRPDSTASPGPLDQLFVVSKGLSAQGLPTLDFGPNFFNTHLSCWQTLPQNMHHRLTGIASSAHAKQDPRAADLHALYKPLTADFPNGLTILSVREFLTDDTESAKRAREMFSVFAQRAAHRFPGRHLHTGILYDLAAAPSRYGGEIREAIEDGFFPGDRSNATAGSLLPSRPIPHQPSSPPPAAQPVVLAGPWEEDLHTLLASVLSVEELHRWVYFNFVDLRTSLPSATHSDPEAFAFTVLDRLMKRGHITEDFFNRLASKVGASHHRRVDAIRARWSSDSLPTATAPQPAPVTQLAAPASTPPHTPSPTITRTTLVLDRIEQWKAIRERCDEGPHHLAFIVHGTRQQNVVLFAERVEKYLKEGRVRRHGTPHRVDRRGDGSIAVTAGDWIGRTIAATDRQRPPIESALRFEAQHHAASFIYFDRGAPLRDLGRDGVDGLTTFLRSELPKALAVTDFKHPLRFFFPVEDDMALAQDLHHALSLPTARKHIHVHDILELKFPEWPEIEDYIHEHFGPVPGDVRGACKRCYDAASGDGHDLRTLADGLRDILHDWEDANH